MSTPRFHKWPSSLCPLGLVRLAGLLVSLAAFQAKTADLYQRLDWDVSANSEFLDLGRHGGKGLFWVDKQGLHLHSLARPTEAALTIPLPRGSGSGIVCCGHFEPDSPACEVLLIETNRAWIASLQAGASFRLLRQDPVLDPIAPTEYRFWKAVADVNGDGCDKVILLSEGRPCLAGVVRSSQGPELKRLQCLDLPELQQPLFADLSASSWDQPHSPLCAGWNLARGGLLSIERTAAGLELVSRRFIGGDQQGAKWLEADYQATAAGMSLRFPRRELLLPAAGGNIVVDDIRGDGRLEAVTWSVKRHGQNILTQVTLHSDLATGKESSRQMTVRGIPLPVITTTGPLTDVNKDGCLDLIVFAPKVLPGSKESVISQALKSGLDIDVEVYLFDARQQFFEPTPSFTVHAFAPAGNVFGGIYGDADGDGICDLWLFGKDRLAVYGFGKPSGKALLFSWEAQRAFDSVFVEDLNNDGRTDVAVRCGTRLTCFLSQPGPFQGDGDGRKGVGGKPATR